MQVVQQHEQVPLGCLLGEGLRDRLPRAEPGRVIAPLCPGVRRKVVAEGTEHARPRIERRSAVVLGATPDDDGDAFVHRSDCELGAQPALADAGLTGDHREHRMVGGLLEKPGECGQLVVAADQRPSELTR